MTKHGGIGLKTLWMVVDGVGLSLVAAATIMEGVHLWTSLLGNCWDEDQLPLTLWFAGRALQLLGLFILIGEFTLVYGCYLTSFRNAPRLHYRARCDDAIVFMRRTSGDALSIDWASRESLVVCLFPSPKRSAVPVQQAVVHNGGRRISGYVRTGYLIDTYG
jgi:hypothetical protein